MSEAHYTIRGREIYSARGKLVATLDDDGNPVWAPGMVGAHSRKLTEWLGEAGIGRIGQDRPDRHETREEKACDEPAAEVVKENLTTEEGNTNVYVGQIPAACPEGGEPEKTESEPKTMEEYSISTIPVDELPSFSRELGVNTPGFREFVERHDLTSLQIAALVKRLENR